MFGQLDVGKQRDAAGGGPGRRIDFGVSDRDGELEQPVVDALVALLDAHLVAMRIAAGLPGSIGTRAGEPGAVVVTIGLDDEGVSLPGPTAYPR